MSVTRRFLIPSVLLMFLAAVSIQRCSYLAKEPPLKELPEAYGMVDGRKIPLLRGGFTWRFPGGRLATTDAPAPDQMVENEPVHPVRPGAEMTLHFTKKDPHTIHASLWERSETLPSRDGKVTLPSEEGTYVLVIDAYWTEGHIQYAATIEVVTSPPVS